MRLTVLSSHVPSLSTVAKDIALVAKSKGHKVLINDRLTPPHEVMRLGDAHITVMTLNPLIASSWILLHRDLTVQGHKAIFYATVEGRPVKRHIHYWMVRDCEFIANSDFTAEMLQEVGLRVADTVHHGVSLDDVDYALRMRTAVRKKLEDKLKAKIILGVVSSSHPRKGLDLLFEAWSKVKQQYDDVALYVATNREALRKYQGVEGAYLDPVFGQLTRTEVLALIASFDFLVHPALAEGFGLPVLEANACGIPAIHVAMPPLIEFSDESINYHVPYEDVQWVDLHDGIEYCFHVYNINDMASLMAEAIECKLNRPSEYVDRQAKAREKARQYSIMNVYPRLLKHVEG